MDRTGVGEPKLDLIPAVTIPKEALEEEVERLASLPAPANGRRVSRVANPRSGVGEGLSPGIDVSISVLKPGERTAPIRHNSSQVNFCIRECGESTIDGKVIQFGQYDVFNTPSWVVYEHRNNTSELQGAADLQQLAAAGEDEDPRGGRRAQAGRQEEDLRRTLLAESPFGTFPISDDGAFLMPYEKLITGEDRAG